MEKKIGDVHKKHLAVSGLRTTENKTPDTNGLTTTAVFNTKIKEVENKIPDVSQENRF